MKLSELRSAPAEPVAEEEPVVASEQPTGAAQVVTPSGLGIYYQSGPKRLYRIFSDPETVKSAVDMWQEVPSASTVLEVLEKGGLSWWGMKVGVQGVATLLQKCNSPEATDRLLSLLHTDAVDQVVEDLKGQKLTVNHVKGQAADRGTNVHTALELYAESGVFPDPELYPENEAGYVRGLVAFLKDTKPEVEHSELMVASTVGYAGRFDLVARLQGGQYVSKCYPKRSSIVDVLEPGQRFLLDLKTSKSVYPSYHLQLAGYEGAMEECGYGTVDQTAVVRVTADGKYELVPGRSTPDQFASVLDVYHIVKGLS